MQCFIYKSLKKDELYLYIEHRDNFTKVPESLLDSLGKLQFVMELELTEERRLARENAGKVIEEIKAKGFFIQMPPVNTPYTKTIQ